MKKKDIDKDLFKRVKSDQPSKAYEISGKSSRQLDRSETAEFVSSQQRIVNTLGEESELAENWERFSNTTKAGEEEPEKRQRRMKVRNDVKKNSTGSARLAANRAAHPDAVDLGNKDANDNAISAKQGQASLQGKGPADASHDVLRGDERQAPMAAGEAQLAGRKEAAPQFAQLEGAEAAERQAGMAGLEGREESGPGQAWLEGSEAEAQAGYAQLQGDDSADAKAGYASLEGQDDSSPDATAMANDEYQNLQAGNAQLQADESVNAQAGYASLEGKQAVGAGHASLQGEEAVEAQAGEASLQGAAERQASQDQLQGMSQEEWDRLHQAGQASLEGGKAVEAGNAALQGDAQTQAGNSSLQGDGPKTRQQILMEAKEKMRRHKADASLQGRNDVEQNVALQGQDGQAAKMGQASLEGRADKGPDQAQLQAEASVERLQGQAILEGKLDTQDQVKLKGKLAKTISKVQLAGKNPVMPATKKPPAEPVTEVNAAPEKPTSRLASRLAQKMSKIREQSADITKESEDLQHRNADD
jgi:hypothetical protein